MARGKKRRVTAGTGNADADDSLVSVSDKERNACGDKEGKKKMIGGCGGMEDEKKTAGLTTSGSKSSSSEASRRNKMKDFFAGLHSFLPHLPPKIGRAELAEETVNYIKFLEREFQTLESRKQDRTKCACHNQKLLFGATSSAISPEHCISREVFLADQLSKTPLQTSVTESAQNQCFALHTSASPHVALSIAGFDAHVSVCAPKTPGLVSATVQFLEKHGAEVLSVQICSDMSRTMFVMHAHVSELDGSMPAEERFKLAKKELILWLASSQ